MPSAVTWAIRGAILAGFIGCGIVIWLLNNSLNSARTRADVATERANSNAEQVSLLRAELREADTRLRGIVDSNNAAVQGMADAQRTIREANAGRITALQGQSAVLRDLGRRMQPIVVEPNASCERRIAVVENAIRSYIQETNRATTP